MSDAEVVPSSRAALPTNHWSRMAAAVDPADSGSRAAPGGLCAAYW